MPRHPCASRPTRTRACAGRRSTTFDASRPRRGCASTSTRSSSNGHARFFASRSAERGSREKLTPIRRTHLGRKPARCVRRMGVRKKCSSPQAPAVRSEVRAVDILAVAEQLVVLHRGEVGPGLVGRLDSGVDAREVPRGLGILVAGGADLGQRAAKLEVRLWSYLCVKALLVGMALRNRCRKR